MRRMLSRLPTSAAVACLSWALGVSPPSSVPQPQPREVEQAPPPERRVIVVGTVGQIDELPVWDHSDLCEGDDLAYNVEGAFAVFCLEGIWQPITNYGGTAFIMEGRYTRHTLTLVPRGRSPEQSAAVLAVPGHAAPTLPVL